MEDDSIQFVLVIVALVITLMLGHNLEIYRITIVHESALAIIFGIFIGSIIVLAFPQQEIGALSHLHSHYFFEYLLPPIIFAAGFTLKKKNFFKNFGTIMLFGIFGTILSFSLISGIIIFASYNDWIYTLDGTIVNLATGEILLFAAIMSACDSVAALSLVLPDTFPNLYGIISGEGIMNDAIAIVLFKSIHRIITHSNQVHVTYRDIRYLVYQFCRYVIGSTSIGLLFGGIISLYFSLQTITPATSRQASVLLLGAYVSYLVSEGMELSGIITLFFAGVTMTHYAWHSMSKQGRIAATSGFRAIGFVMETFLFLCLGLYLFKYTDVLHWSASFIVIVLTSIMCSRFIVVTVFSYLANFRRGEAQITWNMKILIWWSGLIRGALAFVLCLQISSPNDSLLVSTTLGVAIFSNIVFSGLTQVVMEGFTNSGIQVEPVEAIGNRSSNRSGLLGAFRYIDDRFLKRLLRKNWVSKPRVSVDMFQYREGEDSDGEYMRFPDFIEERSRKNTEKESPVGVGEHDGFRVLQTPKKLLDSTSPQFVNLRREHLRAYSCTE